jgi:hypothetical protein
MLGFAAGRAPCWLVAVEVDIVASPRRALRYTSRQCSTIARVRSRERGMASIRQFCIQNPRPQKLHIRFLATAKSAGALP